jgi:hypothetical protein
LIHQNTREIGQERSVHERNRETERKRATNLWGTPEIKAKHLKCNAQTTTRRNNMNKPQRALIRAALTAITLITGAFVFAANAQTTPVQYDVATTYGFITMGTDGTVLNPYNETNNSVVVTVPGASLFTTEPTTTADGSLASGLVTLALQPAPSASSAKFPFQLTLLKARYNRRALLLEVKPDKGTATSVPAGDYVLPLVLTDTASKKALNMNVIVRVQ